MNQETFYRALSQLSDGDINPELFHKLEQHLLDSEEARNKYREFIHIQSLIGLEIDAQQPENVVPVEKIITRQKRRAVKVAVLSAAAILLIGLVTMRLFFVSAREPALVFETSPGTQFELTHSGGNDDLEGTVLEKGSRLTLSQGTVELTFESGVKSIIMAPADLTLHDDDTLFLSQGTAWFEVPKGAEGFTVKTHDLDVVDLGTEFGVLAKPGEHDEVHVLKGKVEVTAKRLRMESATLVAGEARRIDPVGRLTKIPAKATAFMTELPKILPYIHWGFDETKNGYFVADGLLRNLDLGHAKPQSTTAQSMLSQGRYGQAVQFSGKAKEALITQWTGVSGSKPRTVACWVKMPPNALRGGGSSLIAWGLNKSGLQGYHTKWKLAIDHKGRPVVVGYDGAFYADTKSVADRHWHHVACVHQLDKNNQPVVEIYLDGVLQQNVWSSSNHMPIARPDTKIDSTYSYPVCLGTTLGFKYPHAGEVIVGEIDEVYLFEGALDAEAIQRLATDNQLRP